MTLTFISLAPVLGKRIRSVEKLASIQDKWRTGWEKLGDDDKWKRFGDYWRKQDVEKTRNRPSIALAYEERGEEDEDYRLPLAEADETKHKIIVRECYKSFYDFIREARDEFRYAGFVLTGQPGTGASSS